MDDEEWAASVAAGVDEEEPADPELEDDPPDWEGLAAVTAEAREISAAEARDRVYAARMAFDGGFGPVSVVPGPRGPGQAGSSASFPGEHAGPAAGFGCGRPLDAAPGCIALAEFAGAVAGEDDRYPGASDDEIVGVICAWDRVEAHAAARKLAAVAEFIRRRPAAAPAEDPGKGSQADGPQKTAQEYHPKDGVKGGPTPAAGMPPQGWDEFAVKELAWALAESQGAAEGLMAVAYQLEAQLPGTRAALREGRIRLSKAVIIAGAAQFLDAEEAAAAEGMVLGRAGRLTPPGLRAAIGRAVMEVAPEKARRRREEAAKLARVERWAEDTGNAGLAGRELPPAKALAADQRITAWAKELRAAGLDGDLDVLRSQAYLDILLGMDSRPAAPDGAATPGDPADGCEPGPFGPPADLFGPFGPPAGPGAATLPPGFCGSINLTVPLVTAIGLADRPGQAGTLGPIDPWLARDLVRSAARNPRTTWCLTVTDEQGHAIGHGCARPEPRKRARRRTGGGGPGPPGGHDPPGGDIGSPRFSVIATGQHEPPGGYGTWRLTTGVPGKPDLIIPVHPVAAEECDHRFEAAGHDPGVMLRHLSEVRHATCTAPGCRRPASTCDFEHNIPYEAGGRTCLCNGGPKCRRDHRLKQDPKWMVEQPTPATFRWITPTGRVYTTEATRHPI